MWDAAKAGFKGKLIALIVLTRKKKKVSGLRIQWKKLKMNIKAILKKKWKQGNRNRNQVIKLNKK